MLGPPGEPPSRPVSAVQTWDVVHPKKKERDPDGMVVPIWVRNHDTVRTKEVRQIHHVCNCNIVIL